ncbi:pilus assembly protein [Thiohalophilus sp.]|uniref:pilus assembly protein n=1 Tax=Thiohalophilus sp. TaxID=3028392 RepID=UPI00397689F6
MIRVAEGDFRYWSSNERWQCTWDDERRDASNGTSNNPTSAATSDPDPTSDGLQDGTNGPDFQAHVEVCVDGLIGTEKCKEYGSSQKPTGLLHTYGENDSIKFGLMTGSYRFNKSGGVVRKNISYFSDEVDNTDGTFTSVNGIVSTLDKLRIARYRYNDGDTGDSNGTYNISDDCPWGLSSFTDGDCSNWGNPVTEMYLEAVRYFAGLNRNNSFSNNANDDTGYISGLTNVGLWDDPFDNSNYCAACSIIMLNASDFSYDSDSLDMSGLPGSPDASTLTDTVGDEEGISGNDYFVGENGTDNDQLCTPKTISSFGDVKGPCPGSPRLQGSYNIAGIAHWAKTNDIRALTDDQKINTYSVALSGNVPQIRIPVPGATDQFVTVLPACRNDSVGGNCALVNFTIVKPHTDLGGGTYGGSFQIQWEDSEQGGDYDQDMKGTISYEITSSNVTIETKITGDSSDNTEMGFGYTISGTTDDGFHVHSGIWGFTYDEPGITNDCSSGCDGHASSTSGGDSPTNKTYLIGTSSADLLKDPLWYAAKWGGFTDYNNNDLPDLQYEWDQRNNDTGAYESDGIPDNYFLASNPATLESQLNRVFNELLQRLSSGSAAAVIADTVAMTGGVVQALYQPEQTYDNKTLNWTGLVHSVFIDDEGNLREDTNGNATLDDYATDKWIQILYDEAVGRTRVFYCNRSDSCATYDDIREIEEMKPIWNARDKLAEVSNAAITEQRPYGNSFSDSSSGGRHIITWLDDDDGDVDSGEVVDFTDDSFDSSNFGYLNAVDETEAKNIVNFIRGQEGITGYRNRTADYDGNGEKPWRLGDIVHSTPLIVSKPDNNYDTRFGDDTYRDFRAQYENRRGVVYVGANDGMIHAFNAGFFDPNNSRFCLKADCSAASEEDEHPLGAELWAYVPKNLLPHLRWLTEPDYPHVYYMDGKPQAFDVNIFPDDADHPDGWGTILVVGMRLGGSEIDVDYDDDGTTDYTARSAYVILDVTNPETAPTVLAEFTDSDLGFTTSAPQIAVRRQPDDNIDWTEAQAGSDTQPNDWYLVFGNGPTDLDTVTSTNNAQVYALELDLVSGRLDVDSSQVTKIDTGITSSFVGDPAVADWSNDFLSDAIYFGIVGGDASNPDGRLMRVAITTNTVSDWALSANRGTLINPGQPFVHRPELRSIDASPQNHWWVYASTGRLYTAADNNSTETQSMYGIREIHDSTSPNMLPDVDATAYRGSSGDYPVQDVTGVKVFSDGSVEVPAGQGIEDTDGDEPSTFNEFESVINSRQGWYFDFESDGTNPASRGNSRSTFWQNLVLFNSYNPPTDTSCLPEGYSDLWAVYYTTGTAHWEDIGLNKTDPTSTNGAGYPEKMPKIELGYGIASDITLYRTKDGSKPIIQLTTGEIVETDEVTGGQSGSGRQSWREIPLD